VFGFAPATQAEEASVRGSGGDDSCDARILSSASSVRESTLPETDRSKPPRYAECEFTVDKKRSTLREYVSGRFDVRYEIMTRDDRPRLVRPWRSFQRPARASGRRFGLRMLRLRPSSIRPSS